MKSQDSVEMMRNKRKKKFSVEPEAKRKKVPEESADEEEYFQRYKFVLAPKQKQEQDPKLSSDDDNDEDKNSKQQKKHINKKKKKTMKVATTNGKSQTKKLKLMEIESESSDDSEDSLFDEDDLESSDYEAEEEEESGEEEWETDTDYTDGSFHESDCEIISDDDDNVYDYNTDDDDDDYAPPIEDKYIKKGEAILHDANLDLAFGDSTESQIIELDDIDIRVMDISDEEIPKLTPINDIDSTSNSDESPTKTMNRAEDTLKNLSLDDDDELPVQCSQLLQHATFYDCKDDQGVVMKLNRKIYFHGILIIRPLVNSIQIHGYQLNTNETLKATSISGADYFLNLTPVFNEDSVYDKNALSDELKKLIPNSVEEIVNTLDVKTDVLLHLQQGLPDITVEMLITYSNPILPHKNFILKNSACPSSELILATKFFVETENPKLSAFKINHDWDYIEMKQNLRLMMIGGKNVGKTALAQYLINKNIAKFPKILLIDLDIGQPICQASQTMSATLIKKPLIGAGYLSDLIADKCYLFGDKSIMISPFKYNECVSKLMEFCNQNIEYKNIPWIINTMGYQKGFGLQLMCVLLRITQPTEIVQIQHANFRFNFKYIIKEDLVNNYKFSFFNEGYIQQFPQSASFVTHVLDSVVNNNNFNAETDGKWISNAAEKRKMSILAHLSKLLKGGHTYLNEVTPFCTSLNNIRMIVMDEQAAQRDNKVNADLFNANLVYLCHSDSEDEKLDSNSILECYGLGIVRAIDKVHGYIYILMPQHDNTEILTSVVNVLALGNIPLPSEILLKQNYSVEGKVPYITLLKDRNMSKMKYISQRNIKDCF